MVAISRREFICLMGVAGERISSVQLDNSQPIEAGKKYKVAGWATVGSQSPGARIWDMIAEYLRSQKVATINKINTPKLKYIAGNSGYV